MIVGVERLKNNTRNLLAFDPSKKPSPAMMRIIKWRSLLSKPKQLLVPYRLAAAQIELHDEYELLLYATEFPLYVVAKNIVSKMECSTSRNWEQGRMWNLVLKKFKLHLVDQDIASACQEPGI